MINKQTVKYIQSLQHKKFRDEHGAFIAEGPKVVTELLKDNIFVCEALYCTAKGKEMIPGSLLSDHSDKMSLLEDFEMEKLSALSVPNNLLAVFKKRDVSSSRTFNALLTLVLDDIQDPGNLGTIIRNADWFGIKNIICSRATADCYNPKVVQSTMASLGRVNMIYADIQSLFIVNPSVPKYAAVLGGKDIRSLGKIKEGFILIGNESKGISEELLEMADEKISIPGSGYAESLNAAVATGIILFSVTG